MSQHVRTSGFLWVSCTERDLFCWSVLAAAALTIALAGPLLAGRVSTGDDLGAFHLPLRAFYAERLQRGEPFDWMPQLYAGFYLTGEGQAGTYHPLHLLLYRFLPLSSAAGCEWLATYVLMLPGTWLFLRRCLPRSDAAMLGSMLFTFSGFNLLHFVHPNAVAVVAHIPWLLWAIDIVLVDGRLGKVAFAQAAIALLTGSQLLLGYPQYVWFSLLAEIAYGVFVLLRQKRAARDDCETLPTCGECIGCAGNSWGRVVVAKGVGLLLGGVQLLPTIDAFLHSARRSTDALFAASGSLHPLNLLQLVGPYLLSDRVCGGNTHEFGLYVGAVPLTLMVWMGAERRRLGRWAPWVWAVGGFGLAALLMALGNYTPLYRLQTALPLVGSFRFPCRYIVLCHLAAAVLAAIAFMVLTDLAGQPQQPRRSLWKQFEALWALLAVSLAVAVAGLLIEGKAQVASPPAVLAGPLLIGGAVLLVVMTARGAAIAPLGLILLAAADLGFYGLSYAVYPGAVELQQFTARADRPRGPADGRVVANPPQFAEQGLQTGNQITLSGWRRADGYAGLPPDRRLDYRQLPVLRAAGVRWVKAAAAPGTDLLAPVPPGTPDSLDRANNSRQPACVSGPVWQEAPQPLPRVRLLSRVVESHDPAGDMERLDVAKVALVEFPLVLPPSDPGTIQALAECPGWLDVRVACPAPQLLVISESYHAGWQAAVDGVPQPVWRVNGDFFGCLVAGGRHDVRFTFRPRSLALGWLDSSLGVALLAVCLCCYGKFP